MNPCKQGKTNSYIYRLKFFKDNFPILEKTESGFSLARNSVLQNVKKNTTKVSGRETWAKATSRKCDAYETRTKKGQYGPL